MTITERPLSRKFDDNFGSGVPIRDTEKLPFDWNSRR